MKEHFTKEINKLTKLVADQATQVENIIQQSLLAVEQLNCSRAKDIIKSDYQIDLEELHIEEECLKILALYQPVATDLRTVISLLKINTALERIADYGVHIAKRLPILSSAEDFEGLVRIDFNDMAEAVLRMLRQSIQVMQETDTLLAYKVIERDDAIDAMHAENVQTIGNLIKSKPDNVCYYLQAQGVSRDLERIADLASDICENIVYLHTSKIIRHTHKN